MDVQSKLVAFYQHNGHKLFDKDGNRVERPLMEQKPALWAETKGTICEVLKDHHPSYEKSVWTWNDRLTGFVLGGPGFSGSHIDGQIIITQVGSGKAKDKDGSWSQSNDHAWDKSPVTACSNAVDTKRPFTMMACKGTSQLPTEPKPHQGAFVVGRYVATDIWNEHRGGKCLIIMKSEVLDLEAIACISHPTCAPPRVTNAGAATLSKAPRLTCTECGTISPQIWSKGWVCLNLRDRLTNKLACKSALEAQKGMTSSEMDEYNPHFLAERMDRSNVIISQFEAPMPAEELNKLSEQEKLQIDPRDIGVATTCPPCHKGLRRVSLRGWHCDYCNEYDVALPLPVRPLATMTNRPISRLAHPTLELKAVNSEIVTIAFLGLYENYQWWSVTVKHPLTGINFLPVLTGIPTNTAYAAADGPDIRLKVLAKAVNQGELVPERRLVKPSKVSGQLTGYYTWQGGTQYDYTAEHKTAEVVPEFMHIAQRQLGALTRKAVLKFVEREIPAHDQMMVNVYLPGQDINPHGDRNTNGYICSEALGGDAIFQLLIADHIFEHIPEVRPDESEDTVSAPRGTYYGEKLHKLEMSARKTGESEQSLKEKRKKAMNVSLPERPTNPAIFSMHMPHGTLTCMPGESWDGFQKTVYHQIFTDPSRGPRYNVTVRTIADKKLLEDLDYDSDYVRESNETKEKSKKRKETPTNDTGMPKRSKKSDKSGKMEQK